MSRTFSAGLSKRYSTCLGKLFEENELVRKKSVFVFFLQFERKIFGFLLLFFEAWISKVHSACPEKIFEEKSFSNYIICWNFWVSVFSIFSGFRWKKRKQCCQNCVLRVQMNLFGFEKLFWNNVKLWFFPVSEQKHFFVWRETFSAGFSKLLSPCPRELSSKKLIYIEKILLLLLILVLWAETYQTFGKKFLAELLKQHSSCPNGSFEVKIFLSKLNLFINIVKHWAKTCWFLAKNVRHCCQSCILRVEENFWLKIKYFTKISFLINFSGLWVEIFRAFGEKVWGEFFKKAFSMSR